MDEVKYNYKVVWNFDPRNIHTLLENPEGPWMHEDDWLNPQKVIISHRRRWRRDEEISDILEHLVSSAVDEIYEDNRTDSSNDECDDEIEQDTHSEEDYQASEGEEKDSNEENDETPNKDEVQLLPDLSCQFCGKLFTTKGSKKHHENYVHKKDPRKGAHCSNWGVDSVPGCDKVFSNTTSLRYHQLKNHGKAIWCHICSKDFTDFKEFIEHRRKEQDKPGQPALVKCGQCQKKYSKKHLKRHLREVHEVKTPPTKEPAKKYHSCHHCGKQYKRKEVMQRHVVETHSATKQNRRKCEQCEKSFTLERNLKLHVEVEHAHSPFFTTFNCLQCGKSFRRKANLKRHQLEKHKEGNVHSCPSCGKSFARKSNQERHSISCELQNKWAKLPPYWKGDKCHPQNRWFFWKIQKGRGGGGGGFPLHTIWLQIYCILNIFVLNFGHKFGLLWANVRKEGGHFQSNSSVASLCKLRHIYKKNCNKIIRNGGGGLRGCLDFFQTNDHFGDDSRPKSSILYSIHLPNIVFILPFYSFFQF